jgi:hypothetical protein
MFGQAHSWWQRLTAGEPRPGEDRRIWVRFPDERGAKVRAAATADDAALVEARVRDVSRGGIGLIVDRGFEGGSLLLVELPPSADFPGATVLAYVLRADPLPGGGWALGCAFAAEPGSGGLAALTGWPPAAGERRARERLSARGACRYYSIGSYALTRPADVVNLSAAGVGIVADERVEPGAVLAMELACPDGEFVSVIVGVVSVSPFEDGRWLMGCAFNREMDEDELGILWGMAAPAAD